LVIANRRRAASIALMRQKLCSNSTDISFASKLWQVFRAVITGALDELGVVLGDAATLVMKPLMRTYSAYLRKSCNLIQNATA